MGEGSSILGGFGLCQRMTLTWVFTRDPATLTNLYVKPQILFLSDVFVASVSSHTHRKIMLRNLLP